MSLSSPPPPSNFHSQSFNLDNKISPSILLIIVILAIIFFISGLLHLLVRLLLRPTQRDPDELLDHVTVLQGQLQQLFHLHDSGVDQSYIDTLPVFYYKAIIGLKDPFDCAVCLCEFEPDDKLRLLPKCSHAFHMDCIDTWLLSHSTCPLCRSSLLSDYGGGNNHGCSNSIVCVLESGSVENSREIGFERERVSVSVSGSNPRQGESEFGSGRVEFPRKSCENNKNEEKIMSVKLGKFRNVDVGEGSSVNDNNNASNNSNRENSNSNSNSNNNNNISGGNNDLGSRRCYSMGSFAYILDETNALQVPIRNNTPMKKQKSKKPILPLKPGHRAVMSEYGCDSQREFNGIEAFKNIDNLHATGNGNGTEKSKRRDGFSISKIWERNKKGNESSRRTNSEYDVSELGGGDEETQSCYSVDSIAYPTTSTSSTTRRTLLWLMGRQNKIVHNHSTSLSSSSIV
ncbi:RING-H2 finger protein ATL13-like [Silene latifolia]|uniref:RING-H2 finger protein ATL13-like n=1 Tax=Silene latifolia TaxID=37657 RepID=UPI003D77D515